MLARDFFEKFGESMGMYRLMRLPMESVIPWSIQFILLVLMKSFGSEHMEEV